MTIEYRNVSVLADYITRHRTEKGWSQRELARRSHVSYGTIQKLEACEIINPGVFTLKEIASALGVSLGKMILAYQEIDPDNPEQVAQQDADNLETLTREVVQEFIEWQKSRGRT